MIIKKHKNKNDYFLAGNGLWVRNFTKKNVKEIDINKLLSPEDMRIILENEMENYKKTYQRIDTEDFTHKNIIIINSGYQFNSKILESFPDDIIIIGVNKVLDLWNINKKMHYYLINNPYDECLEFLPKQQRVFPRCIASTRTNPGFLEKFKGLIYSYNSTADEYYSGLRSECEYFIDDYRNAICAAIGLAYKFKVQKLLLLFADEVYETFRPGMVKSNNYWIYEQQEVAHKLIDANFYWLKDVKVGYYPKLLEFKNGSYIEEIVNFFKE